MLQTTALINREATGRDVDKWMEDLFARIQLCILHPHSVIHQDGTASQEEIRLAEPGEILVNTMLLDEFPAAAHAGTAGGLPDQPIEQALAFATGRVQDIYQQSTFSSSAEFTCSPG